MLKKLLVECQWLTPILLAAWEAEIRRIMVLGQPGQEFMRTHLSISKRTRAKWTGGVAQVVKHLLCKCKALSSNTSVSLKKIIQLSLEAWVKW
jgi:hypothetical protein